MLLQLSATAYGYAPRFCRHWAGVRPLASLTLAPLLPCAVFQAVDVYSFGVLLWEMFCHARAWCGCLPSQVRKEG